MCWLLAVRKENRGGKVPGHIGPKIRQARDRGTANGRPELGQVWTNQRPEMTGDAIPWS